MENFLSALDLQVGRGQFPQLDNGYVYLAGVKLTAFGDRIKWAVVFEILGYHYKYYSESGFRNSVSLFGNSLPPPHIGAKFYDFQCLTSPGTPLLVDNGARVNTSVGEILIGEPPTRLVLDEHYISRIGLNHNHGYHLTPAEFLRALSGSERERLFLTREQLDRMWSRRPPTLLSLAEWSHPDVKVGQLPSQTSTFSMLSDVIRYADPTLYVRERVIPNTHWSNWPLGGAL